MFIRSVARAPWLPFVARIFLSLVFVISGFEKLQNFEGSVSMIGSLTNPSGALLLTVIVIIFELGGGLMLLANWHTDIALDMLVVFLVVATILVHANLSDASKVTANLQQIEKNLAILGGLFLMGRFSFLQEEMNESL